jgi:hypothetical protein
MKCKFRCSLSLCLIQALYHSVDQSPAWKTAFYFSARLVNILHYSLRTDCEAHSVFPVTSLKGTSLWVRRPDLEAGLSGLLQRLRTRGTSFDMSYRIRLCRYSAWIKQRDKLQRNLHFIFTVSFVNMLYATIAIILHQPNTQNIMQQIIHA